MVGLPLTLMALHLVTDVWPPLPVSIPVIFHAGKEVARVAGATQTIQLEPTRSLQASGQGRSGLETLAPSRLNQLQVRLM